VQQHFPQQTCLIFIAPPSLDVLKARLLTRGTNTPADMQKRLAIAESELAQQHLFDVVIVNNQLDQALAALVSTIKEYLTR
jgi:guanylate kinase